MDNRNMRWKQRFENYQNSLQLLERILQKDELNEIEEMGLIQSYELTFELGWKTLKDYLESEGFLVTSPREVLKTAFAVQIIEDGHIWLEALESRNELAHVYQEAVAAAAVEKIESKYHLILKKLYDFFQSKLNG
jgi:nucleotidyltransferase substrate binding protein (TIGR01987 family)